MRWYDKILAVTLVVMVVTLVSAKTAHAYYCWPLDPGWWFRPHWWFGLGGS